MNTDKSRLHQLFQRWNAGEITDAEKAELLQALEDEEQQPQVLALMKEAWNDQPHNTYFTKEQKEKMLQQIVKQHKSPIVTLRRITAAAAILLLIVTGVFFLYHPSPKKQQIVSIEKPQQRFKNDVSAPESNKAVLTLANGQKLILDSAGNGSLAVQGRVKIVKLADGKIAYAGDASEINFNTLTVPRGSKPVQLTLADGTSVTVNVASSITYPTAFIGNERKVTITGEAYFEVAPSVDASKKRPFLVSTRGMNVEVLGTHFNINAYSDEKKITTTLLEGAIKINAGDKVEQLEPGQQAVVNSAAQGATGDIRLIKNADTEDAVAWLKGRFAFTNADVETVMRQVARWYNVEVVYKGKPTMRFGGQIDRNSTLVQMFTILETSGIRFTIDGKQVTVLP